MSTAIVGDSGTVTGPGSKVTVVVPVASVARVQSKPREVTPAAREGGTVPAGGAGHSAGRQSEPMSEASRHTPSQTVKPAGQTPGGAPASPPSGVSDASAASL